MPCPTHFFAEFLDLFLPDASAYIDPDRFEFLDKEIFTGGTAGKKHEADLVVPAHFRDIDAFFVVHVENQAKAQPDFNRRMFRYFAQRHDLPIYPARSSHMTRPNAQSRTNIAWHFQTGRFWSSASGRSN